MAAIKGAWLNQTRKLMKKASQVRCNVRMRGSLGLKRLNGFGLLFCMMSPLPRTDSAPQF
jgi:hypothetical protein